VNDDVDARFHADLARAIADSKANASPTTSIISLSTDSDADQATSPPAAAPSSSVFLTERAQLEQERLARLKRLRGDSDDSHRAVPPPPKRSVDDALASQEKEVALDPEGGEVFWDGELRQTANKHVEPRRNGEDGKPVFRLSQIIGDVRSKFPLPNPSRTLLTPRIQKTQIELAIISTYALQLSWIYTFFDPSTPVVLVTQPAPSENGSATIKQVLPNWIRVTPFLRGGRGVMHMKVCLTSPGDICADINLFAKVLPTFLQVRQITDRHLNREPDGSRLARH
jgi:tyrosyl-DNA phosphodiesterase-1